MSNKSLSGPVGVVPNDAKTGEKGEPMTPIPSATLIVLCPLSSSSNQYATLMVQRKATGSFRSATVFPGGLLDKADVYAISETFKHDNSSSLSSSSNKNDQYLESLRLCALRETFEETGLLIIPTNDNNSNSTFSRAIGPSEAGISSEEWTELRKSVHDDARTFKHLLHRVIKSSSSSEDGLPLPILAPLRHHSNWVTPRTLVRPAKRFDTHFFVTILDKPDALGKLTSAAKDEGLITGLPLGMTADGKETTQLRIAKPEELLKMAIKDEIILFPPQYYLLADVLSFLNKINGKNEKINFTPLHFGIEQNPEQNTSTNQAPAIQGVSSVEPQGIAASGGMFSLKSLSIKSRKQKGNKNEDDEEEEELFVLPLALPGDELRPIESNQQQSKSSSKPPRNRVYVTPRSRGEGGGMMVHGAHRRGIKGLIDFQFGNILSELEGESNDDENRSKERDSKL